MTKVKIIAIAGGSASGKSSIASKIINLLKDRYSINLIRQDDYYKENHHLSLEERKKINYDHPFSFDNDLFIQDLKKLKDGKSINRPIYDFVLYDRTDQTVEVKASEVILIEGLFVLENPQLREMADLKIFVDTAADERFIRRLKRDVSERGRSLDSVIEQYLTTTKPMHEQFVEYSKKYADVIIPEGSSNQVAIDMLCNQIIAYLKEEIYE